MESTRANSAKSALGRFYSRGSVTGRERPVPERCLREVALGDRSLAGEDRSPRLMVAADARGNRSLGWGDRFPNACIGGRLSGTGPRSGRPVPPPANCLVRAVHRMEK
uniref:Uncharacterized protein n=1 Tax=Ananas comosus var. bracteatus TaxID=296719 RepID=A0A6V7NFK2_ANACO|nr:unnamed protein product [Ananas comosus var. bracteatus]